MRKILVLFISLLFLFSACTKARATEAPDFTLKDTEGKTIHLANYRGKAVILNFWATWCPPCLVEIPDFVRFYNNSRKKGIEIIGIAVSSNPQEIKKFIKEYKITYPVCVSDRKIELLYGGIRAVPTTFIIDRKGNIHSKRLGAISEAELQKLLEGVL